MPHVRRRRPGDARRVHPRLREERHRRQQPAVAAAPHADTRRIGDALVDQISRAAVQILDVDAAVIEPDPPAERLAPPRAAADVDGEEDVSLLQEELIQAPRGVRGTPAPLVAHRVRVDRPENRRVALPLPVVGRQRQPTVERCPVEVVTERDVTRLHPGVLRELRQGRRRHATLRTLVGRVDVEAGQEEIGRYFVAREVHRRVTAVGRDHGGVRARPDRQAAGIATRERHTEDVPLLGAAVVADDDHAMRCDGRAEHGPVARRDTTWLAARTRHAIDVVVLVAIGHEVETFAIRRPRGPPLRRHVLGLLLAHEQRRREARSVDEQDAPVLHEHVALVDGQLPAVWGPLVSEDDVHALRPEVDPPEIASVGADDAEAPPVRCLAGERPADLDKRRFLGQVVGNPPDGDRRAVVLDQREAPPVGRPAKALDEDRLPRDGRDPPCGANGAGSQVHHPEIAGVQVGEIRRARGEGGTRLRTWRLGEPPGLAAGFDAVQVAAEREDHPAAVGMPQHSAHARVGLRGHGLLAQRDVGTRLRRGFTPRQTRHPLRPLAVDGHGPHVVEVRPLVVPQERHALAVGRPREPARLRADQVRERVQPFERELLAWGCGRRCTACWADERQSGGQKARGSRSACGVPRGHRWSPALPAVRG
jgi:hypothetical protein